MTIGSQPSSVYPPGGAWWRADVSARSSVRDKVIPMKRFLIACGPVAFIGASTSPPRASPTAGCPDESSHALAVAFRNGLYGGLPAGRASGCFESPAQQPG